MELDALIAPAHVGTAVGGAVAHGIAGQDAAVAVAVGVDKAAAGDGEDTVVIFRDGADMFAGHAQLAGGIDAQPAGIFGHGQHAQVARAGDAHQQHLVFGVDGQHLLAVDGLDRGAGIIETGLVDVEVVPAVFQGLGMFAEIGFQGGLIDLIEERVEVLLGLLFGIDLGDHLYVGLDLVGGGVRVGNRLFGFLLAPAGAHTDLLLQRLPPLIHNVFDDIRRDNGGGQPFVAQRIHGGFDIDGAPFGDKAVVGVDGDKVENFDHQQAPQHDGQALEGITPFGRGGHGDVRACGSQSHLAVLGQAGAGSGASKQFQRSVRSFT